MTWTVQIDQDGITVRKPIGKAGKVYPRRTRFYPHRLYKWGVSRGVRVERVLERLGYERVRTEGKWDRWYQVYDTDGKALEGDGDYYAREMTR